MIIREKIALDTARPFIKVVVDISRKILAYGCELHIDCAEELLGDGSLQKDLWGANVYPEKKEIDFISLINIRPQESNRSMKIERPEIRKAVEDVMQALLF